MYFNLNISRTVYKIYLSRSIIGSPMSAFPNKFQFLIDFNTRIIKTYLIL